MYHLAQVNIARMRAQLDDPIMAGFVAQLATINALADASPGFVWRLQTAEGDATSLRPYGDPLILMNISVWATLDDYMAFAYASAHRDVMKQRTQWFEQYEGHYVALWWVAIGHIPSVAEAMERLDMLRDRGETPKSFSIRRPFMAPSSPIRETPTPPRAAHV